MTLSNYRELIRNLPYLDQAFETKKQSWQKQIKKFRNFKEFCDERFEQNHSIKLSRRDLFVATNNETFESALYQIVFWGYPRNMRGNNLDEILSRLPTIKKAFSPNHDLGENDFQNVLSTLKGTHIGLSTLTKMLYFFNYRIDNYKCLILDSRLIEIIQSKVYMELLPLSKLSLHNKAAYYLEYVKIIAELADAQNYLEDQLEFFLFHFGKNLKGGVASTAYKHGL